MSFQNVGTYNAGVFTPKAAGPAPVGGVPVMDADGIASGGAFLVSELEKRDPLIRKPLTSFTYPRDIVIQTGGGWVDYVSAMSVAYGITGGAVNSPVTAGGANGIPVVQASVDKGVYKAHVFAAALRVMFQDMQRANYIGRSLDNLLQDGVRMAYDKHMDANGYVGIGDYGTTGLVNNPDATETTAVNGAKGTAAWATKTPQEILKDVNDAITSVWAANEYDETAVPNHILIPYEQYNYILTTMVTDLATETIYDFLLKNNAAAKNGGSLFIGATRWCKGAGTGDKDRMVVYVNHERFVKMDELVPMSRIMSAPNVANVCYTQLVAAGLTNPDDRFVVNIMSGVVLSDGTALTPQQVTWWAGGALAGAQYNESLTYAAYPNAVDVSPKLTNSGYIDALTAGQFVLFADDGVVKVEQDINSLVTYTTDITGPYHKNRVIRLLNTIANDIYQQFSDGYIGVVNNNEQGRMMFKSAIVGYLLDIQANNGIQNFEAEDVTVEPGEAIDAIVVNLAIQPVDSVEKIYVTITVN